MIINSPYITGSITISGFLTGSFTGSFSGSLFGTASQATSASLAATSSVAYSGTGSFSGSFTGSLSGSFSGSLFGTASYATFALSAGGASGFPFTGSASITGSFRVSGSTNISASSYAMAMLGSGSNVFTVDGTSGRLFQVDDSLSGSLFSVNTAAGLPVIEAFSDNTVRIGQFGQKVLFVSQSKVGVGTETPVTNLDVSGSVRITNGLSETGSVNISGSVTMTGSFTTSGTITAQTLVVQTITSSIEYSSGSNIFGSLLTNTQTFTGSVNITGSITQTGVNTTSSFSGLVGIGTTTPTSALQIYRTAYTGNQFKTYAELQAAPTTLTYSTSDGFGLILNMYEAVSGNPYTRYADIVANTGDISDSAMRFFTKAYSTNIAERMRITPAGNVGIGLTNPSALLHISGSGSGSLMQISSHVSSSIFYVSGSGNIGIGTTTPSVKLQVVGDGLFNSNTNTNLTINSNGGVAGLTLTNSAGSQIIYGGTGGSNVMDFYTNSAFKVRIDASGNVGIGTTSPTGSGSPSNLLHLAGSTAVLRVGPYFTTSDRDFVELQADGANTKVYSPNEDFSFYNPIGNANITGSTVNICSVGNTRFFNNGTEKMRITSGSHVYIGEGYSNTNHRINLLVSQGSNVLVVSAYSTAAADTAIFYSVDGGGANAAAAALKIGNNTTNSRSINAGGSINASGADYAEYMTKAIEANIAKGDIVGVDENGLLTNIFEDSKSFVVKSTNPSYVGGDTWGTEEALGEKRPQKITDQTDEEFATLTDIFEAKLEIERAKVDRIAFSGQVPCNVTGATVGDYIVPIELENGKIGGQAVTNPTFEQYQISVGKVWKIMEDGRAWIAVKIG